MITFFFIKYSLNQENITVTERDEDSGKLVKTRDVKVTLEIFEELDAPSPSSSYSIEMSNLDTVEDLIHKLRSDDLISYEITSYIDGFELNHVNRIFPNMGEKWAVFYNDENITSRISSIKLENKSVYSLKLIRIEEPQ